MNNITSALHSSPFGNMVSDWTDRGLYSLAWTASAADHPNAGSATAIGQQAQRLDELLEEFFATGHTDFGDIVIDATGWSEFRRRIYHFCRQIPAGETWTYKELARAAGNERASRAAGAAMARNRVPIVIPCHRVIASGGGLRGFSAPGGLETKQWLLDLEQQQPVSV